MRIMKSRTTALWGRGVGRMHLGRCTASGMSSFFSWVLGSQLFVLLLCFMICLYVIFIVIYIIKYYTFFLEMKEKVAKDHSSTEGLVF